MSASAQAHAAAPRLERPRHGRAIAGVCAGLGRHLNIDPIIVRIVFVVLVFAGGAGFVAYGAGLLLIPEEGEREPLIRNLTGHRLAMVAGVVLLIVGSAAAIDALVGDGLGHMVAWSVVLLGVGGWLVLRPFDRAYTAGDTPAVTAETAVVPPPPRPRASRIVGGTMLLAAGLVTVVAAAGVDLGAQEIAGIAIIAAGVALAAGAFFGASPWLALPPLVLAACVAALAAAGVALRGPIGDREFHPLAVAELPSTYRLAIGQARLDLGDISLPPGTTTVKLRVGIGEARVTVPAGVTVKVKGHTGAGDVRLPGGRSSGTDVDRNETLPGNGVSTLVLDARVGLGELRVERAAGVR